MAVLGPAGCTQSTEPDVTADEQAFTSERAGQDVTVLQGWLGKTVGKSNPSGPPIGQVSMNLTKCQAND